MSNPNQGDQWYPKSNLNSVGIHLESGFRCIGGEWYPVQIGLRDIQEIDFQFKSGCRRYPISITNQAAGILAMPILNVQMGDRFGGSHVTLFYVMSRRVTSFHIAPRHFIRLRGVSWHVKARHPMSRHAISFHFVPWHVASERGIPHISRHVISRHVMSCHAMSCVGIPWPVARYPS